MKSRSSSPQTSPQVVKRYRVDSNTAVPAPSLRKSSLRIEELSRPNMNGYQTYSSPASAGGSSPAPGLLGTSQNGGRKFSDHSAPASENSQAWSSAVGHATTSGKSGRVIERLMAENDRLKRELNAQIIRNQELEKSVQTYKPRVETLLQENDNLSHARDVDLSLISRRDRKIEQLKAELLVERSRREKAEALARQREQEKDEIEERCRREVQRLTDSTKHATLHAEILETSHRQLAAEYRARVENLRKDLSTLTDGREQDRQKFARLDVVLEHMRSEFERHKKANADVLEAWERMREESDRRLRGVAAVGEEENDRARKLSVEMDQVVNKMRWVMNVRDNVKDAQ